MRLRVLVRGAVQGVGFRPFVYRLAQALELRGFAQNSAQGVTIEVEGARPALCDFERRLRDEAPPRALIHGCETAWLAESGADSFEIRPSAEAGPRTALVLPDVATCDACLRELFDPGDRRFRYPFINCTDCGPRYSIVRSLPYDRARTSMARFTLCARCRAEYENPAERRFHAEPNACPECGPQLELRDRAGKLLAQRDSALLGAVEALRAGRVLALQGLGGFHLLVDACDEAAVVELRRRKHRPAKPLAVMASSPDAARLLAELEALEAELLTAPEAPIVLVARRADAPLARSIAPDGNLLGLMLPSTPLHHLLLRAFGSALVATSGNLAGEPLCTRPDEALARLAGVADVFLVHQREIVRPVDDSLVRVCAGRPLVLRRARGYAPLPVAQVEGRASLVAVGAHLKNAVALAVGGRVFLGPHVGDLDTLPVRQRARESLEALCALYGCAPDLAACDEHPDYATTGHARALGVPVHAAQHHYAHVLACMADNDVPPPALGIAWDGSGYGPDGSVWGGEALRVGARGFERVGHLRRFPLPGGEAAVREPRRAALGLLWACEGERAFTGAYDALLAQFSPLERRVLPQMLRRGVNSPSTSSAGRLFDAVAALCGLHPRADYEGQAAVALECSASVALEGGAYAFGTSVEGGVVVVDWEPMLRELLGDLERGGALPCVARRLHDTLAEMIVAQAKHVGERRVVLSGGCFQNRVLTERALLRLRACGFKPFWHRSVPPGDGGLALGQIVAALRDHRGA